MTTASKTNYGVILGLQDSNLAYNAIGEVVSVDPPEFMNPEIEATNHSSGGVREFVSSKLMEMSTFKATINYVSSDLAPLVALKAAGTKSRYQIAFDSVKYMQFGALVTSIKPLSADAQNPDVLKAEITFRPSDSLVMA